MIEYLILDLGDTLWIFPYSTLINDWTKRAEHMNQQTPYLKPGTVINSFLLAWKDKDKYHKLCGLEQQKCILSQFGKHICNQAVYKVVLSLKGLIFPFASSKLLVVTVQPFHFLVCDSMISVGLNLHIAAFSLSMSMHRKFCLLIRKDASHWM